jgi:RimJ/RimL family protein N-acetyltransferase
MPRLTDREQIRNLLETDRPWAVYALADLEPGLFEHAHWFCPAGGEPALALFFAGFATPVLITVGKPHALRAVLDEIADELSPRELYAVIKPEVMPLLDTRYRVLEKRIMQRMVFAPAQYRPMPMNHTVLLRIADLEAVRRLYADGDASGEAPDWFLPQMLEQETYYGIMEHGELIAAAGTHVVSLDENVACLGNIYTRRDRRGRGLGTQVTTAVLAKLLSMDIATIVLNVRASNAAAIHVYERIGFRPYCHYIEAPLLSRG